MTLHSNIQTVSSPQSNQGEYFRNETEICKTILARCKSFMIYFIVGRSSIAYDDRNNTDGNY